MIFNRHFLILTLFSSLASSGGHAQVIKYNLADLEALEKEKNFNEFFNHAMDIRPSERQKIWKKMYQNMAIQYIDEKLKNKDFSKEFFKQIENFNKMSFLLNDEVFQFKRNQFNLNYFKTCYQSTTSKTVCDMELENFWENSNRDPDIALDLVEWLKDKNSQIDSWKFVDVIIKDQIAPIYCKKNIIVNSIIKKISDQSFNQNFDGNYGKIAQNLVPENCLKELSPVFKTILSSNESNGLEKEMAFSVLDYRQELDSAQKDFYLSLYLFSGPVVGEKMNLAWKLVEVLGENAERRNQVIRKIKELDKIPDKLFYDPMNSRNKAIIAHFSKNFPEALNLYADECLTLLKGNNDPKVSSYLNCNQFFQSAIKLKTEKQDIWINDSISTQYSALKKLK